jgi:hypothetical protein
MKVSATVDHAMMISEADMRVHYRCHASNGVTFGGNAVIAASASPAQINLAIQNAVITLAATRSITTTAPEVIVFSGT